MMPFFTTITKVVSLELLALNNWMERCFMNSRTEQIPVIVPISAKTPAPIFRK